jgi:hypothetical protein
LLRQNREIREQVGADLVVALIYVGLRILKWAYI